MTSTIKPILEKAIAGQRLTPAEGLALFECRDLHALGRAANAVCQRLHPEPYRTYNIDRNINYTNVCAAVCDFCAFYRKSSDADAYVLPRETLGQGMGPLTARMAYLRRALSAPGPSAARPA